MLFRNKPYLLIITNLFCNHRCSYCIQQESSLDVRLNQKKIDVPAVLQFLAKNRIDQSVKVMGGEATLHPDFDSLIDGLLKLYKKVVLTTNLNGKWYKDFDGAAQKIAAWGQRLQWNTTFHPAWMDVDLYIERIRALQRAGVRVGQVASTDTPDLSDETAKKLDSAGIDWKLQTFTGRDKEGRLRPQTWDDINTKFAQLYDPSKYIDHYDEYIGECEDANYSDRFYRLEWVNCKTSRFLIGPDNHVYPCHRHLYVEDRDYVCGSIYDTDMRQFRVKWNPLLNRWSLPCNTKCSPCDFKNVKITPLGRPATEAASQESA